MKHSRSAGWAVTALAVATGWLAPLAVVRAQAPIGDYQFQQVYTSTGGVLGALTPINPTSLTFVNATVNGNSQYVLQASSPTTGVSSSEGGVQTPANPFTNGGVYTLNLLASFNISTANVAATKIFDFKNLTSDAGLYLNAATGSLQFIDVVAGTSAPVVGGTGASVLVTGTYYQLSLTRTAAGVVTAYLNGAQELQFTDTDGAATVNTALTLFTDDGTGIGGSIVQEGTTGSIARLRLFDSALTGAQIAALVPEPSTWTMLAGGGILLGFAALRRRRAA